jgi:hypothetical protein
MFLKDRALSSQDTEKHEERKDKKGFSFLNVSSTTHLIPRYVWDGQWPQLDQFHFCNLCCLYKILSSCIKGSTKLPDG